MPKKLKLYSPTYPVFKVLNTSIKYYENLRVRRLASFTLRWLSFLAISGAMIMLFLIRDYIGIGFFAIFMFFMTWYFPHLINVEIRKTRNPVVKPSADLKHLVERFNILVERYNLDCESIACGLLQISDEDMLAREEQLFTVCDAILESDKILTHLNAVYTHEQEHGVDPLDLAEQMRVFEKSFGKISADFENLFSARVEIERAVGEVDQEIEKASEALPKRRREIA